MLMVTRSDSCIEFKLGDDSTIAIDVARLSGAMLAIERMPCGHVRHALVLTVAGRRRPLHHRRRTLRACRAARICGRDDAGAGRGCKAHHQLTPEVMPAGAAEHFPLGARDHVPAA